MIKRYLEFIREYNEQSLGELVKSLSNDEYVMNIVNRFIKDIEPTIDLENAINILDDKTKADIRFQIDEYLQRGIEEKNPEIVASTDLEELTESSDISIAGKGIFTSFLKAITSLGGKEIKPNWEETPDDFLIFYSFKNLESNIVKEIFSRFKSLQAYVSLIDYQQNEVSLFFGLRCDGNFEYGFQYDKLSPIGKFKLTASVIKWMLQLESKSAQSLKKEIVNLNLNDVLTLGLIKSDMKDFNPGYFEKRLKPTILDKVITFGFFGVGRWDNGKLDEGEFQNIKNNFTTWLLTKKWGSKVLISVKPESFWIYLHIKLK